jgi:hypothetical protein
LLVAAVLVRQGKVILAELRISQLKVMVVTVVGVEQELLVKVVTVITAVQAV